MKIVVIICLFLSTIALACSASPSPLDDTTGGTIVCQANTLRQCPCLGSASLGTQVCDWSGNRYGPCSGCPEPPSGSDPLNGETIVAGSGGTGPAQSLTDAAMSGAGTGPSVGGSDGAPPVTDAGMSQVDATVPQVDSGVPQGDATGPEVEAGPLGPEFGDINIMAPGTSCGVGLPRLCELGTEKCCVRSLDTDTCIPLDATCDCQYAGCQVMQAYCDGPEDCEGNEVCCGTVSILNFSDIRYTLIECTTQCNTAMGSQYEVCHQGETECGPGMICANSQLLTNIQVCVDPSSIEQ